MARFEHRDTLTLFGFPNGLSALHVGGTAAGPVLYAATTSGGGVTAFAPDGGGGLLDRGALAYPGSLVAGVVPTMADFGGDVVVSGLAGRHLTVGTSGAPSGWSTVTGHAAALGAVHRATAGGTPWLLGSETGGDLVALEAVPGGLSVASRVPGLHADGIAQAADGTLYAISGATDRITRLTLDADGTLAVGQVAGALDGLGWDAPSAIRLAAAGGAEFLVVAAAGSSSLTVLGFGDTVFEIADHIIDDKGTRFGGVVALDTVTVNGRTFVAAGGADDGVTIFELLPGGRLVHLQTEIDTTDLALSNVSAVAFLVASGQVSLAAAGQADAGITVLSRPASSLAPPRSGGNSGVSLTGGAVDDLLLGGAGADSLSAGAGDDILYDGEGADSLRGGAGADIFVFASDGATDRVEDFEPGVDRLDLSAFPGLYALADLSVVPTATGARLGYRDEVVEIRTATGTPLEASDLALGDVLGVTRPPLVAIGRDVAGTAGPDTLFGATGDDRLRGLGGDDTLTGLDGHDMLLGGAGSDVLDGGPGRDIAAGGAGADRADGGAEADLLMGGAGADLLAGGDGGDVLSGGSGDDRLEGGGGNDVLRGGSGDDALVGGEGADRLSGGEGADTLDGGSGADRIDGGAGRDLLTGGPGADLFVFREGSGEDRVADFAPGEDRVDLSLRPDVADWPAVEALLSPTPEGAVIDFGGGDILLFAGLDPAVLGADDFLFALS